MDQVERLRSVVEQRKPLEEEASRQLRLANSKRKLEEVLKRKFRTTFIGALDHFEKTFGHLWGHELCASDCTERQIEWREYWERCRIAILDNGNDQLRSAKDELSLYDVEWNGHVAQISLKPGETKSRP